MSQMLHSSRQARHLPPSTPAPAE
ncbi:uncharacterized protein METZ01_LOCUS275365, partial [marine metagenome]